MSMPAASVAMIAFLAPVTAGLGLLAGTFAFAFGEPAIDRAIALDSGYALAYAGKASATEIPPRSPPQVRIRTACGCMVERRRRKPVCSA